MKRRMNYDAVCVNCEHYDKNVQKRSGMTLTSHLCNATRDLVTGNRYLPVSCVSMRDKNGQCGPEGRLYVARKAEAAE